MTLFREPRELAGAAGCGGGRGVQIKRKRKWMCGKDGVWGNGKIIMDERFKCVEWFTGNSGWRNYLSCEKAGHH
jgi:hypothetical protein